MRALHAPRRDERAQALARVRVKLVCKSRLRDVEMLAPLFHRLVFAKTRAENIRSQVDAEIARGGAALRAFCTQR